MALLVDMINTLLSFGDEFTASPMSFVDGQSHANGLLTKGPSAVADGETLQEDLIEMQKN